MFILFCRACPQCRVKSPFYIPNKYWVENGKPKEDLIASFKERSRLDLIYIFNLTGLRYHVRIQCIAVISAVCRELLIMYVFFFFFHFSKLKCRFYSRDGCCPFQSECIYRHEGPPGRPRRRTVTLTFEIHRYSEFIGAGVSHFV